VTDRSYAKRERLVRARFDAEIDRAMAFVEERLLHLHRGILGRIYGHVAAALFDAVARKEMVRRVDRQLDVLFRAARECGEDLDTARRMHLGAFLETEEAYLNGNRDHPAWPELVARLDDAFTQRLAHLSALLHRGRGEDYESLVRSTFPSAKEASGAVDRQFEAALAVLELCERERALLRIPGFLRGDVFRILRELQGWYRRSLEEEIARIYAEPAPE